MTRDCSGLEESGSVCGLLAEQSARNAHTDEVKLLTSSSCDAEHPVSANALWLQAQHLPRQIIVVQRVRLRFGAGVRLDERSLSQASRGKPGDAVMNEHLQSCRATVGNPLLQIRCEGATFSAESDDRMRLTLIASTAVA
jgi:hypothetical protein